jgi:hypothetical protein
MFEERSKSAEVKPPSTSPMNEDGRRLYVKLLGCRR